MPLFVNKPSKSDILFFNRAPVACRATDARGLMLHGLEETVTQKDRTRIWLIVENLLEENALSKIFNESEELKRRIQIKSTLFTSLLAP